MDRIIWSFQIVLGWACYRWLMASSYPFELTPILAWALSWAGFYAYDDGFENLQERRAAKALGEK